jgi:hypothetical protein
MRPVLFLGLIAPVLFFSAPAEAKIYPWCAWYDWTTYNCGFDTYGQCLATVSGAGGWCQLNAFQAPPPPPARKRVKKRTHAH